MATHVSVSGTSHGNDYPQNADDNAETTNLLGEPSSSYSLPPFTEMQEPRFQWGACEGDSFRDAVDLAYAEVIHWRRNIFKVPSGKIGKAFVAEVSRLIRAYAEGSTLEPVALKCVMSMPALLLQKPHRSSKVKEHISCLERRLKLWVDGDIDSLLHEGRTIQNHLQNSPCSRKSEVHLAQSFSKLMFEGKVKQALRLLAAQGKGGTLNLDSHVPASGTCNGAKTVREILFEKHPKGQPIKSSTVIIDDVPSQGPRPVLYERIDGPLIHSIALKTEGAAGPSGIDAAGWRRLLSSFQKESVELCEAVASMTRRLCQQYVDPAGLTAFTACRLVALDKCPGVRPVGIGEVVRRIAGKAILSVTGMAVQEVTGALQVCSGQQGGCEAAIHAMRHVFSESNTEAVLLVDATNAFNQLNRQAALQNIMRLCPEMAPAIVNTYRSNAQLFIDGETILSEEGTTQGDPLAMAMYAIATVPLIHQLDASSSVRQVWFADDATAGGQLSQINDWWQHLVRIGPNFGYHANGSKSWLIVKEEHIEQATLLFEGTGIQITKEGQRHLGAALGTQTFIERYVTEKVHEWSKEVNKLAEIATSQPHAVYAALTHGLQSKWTYLTRTVPNISDLLEPLEYALRQKLLPVLTGRDGITDTERELFALPIKFGGLGIANPTKTANAQYSSSQRVTAPLTALILQQEHSYPSCIAIEQKAIKSKIKGQRREQEKEDAERVRAKLPVEMQRTMSYNGEKGASQWLGVLPLTEFGFSLHKGAFRDALALRYGWTPRHVPSQCACGKRFTVEHAFSCPFGGFPSLRHNDIRDTTACLLSEVCHNVALEPSLMPLSGERLRHKTANTEDGARLDIRAQGFWGERHQSAFFDVRVFNPFAPSNTNSTPESVYKRHENEKRRNYEERVREVEHGSFTPLVFSATGGMGKAATVMYQRLASLLSVKRAQSYSKTMSWLRCQLTFSLLRSAITCIRGSRSAMNRPGRSLEINASIPLAASEGRIPGC